MFKQNLLSFFPKKDTPRKPQETILNSVQGALEKHKKFIIIQAPTGSGKSHLAATLANYSRESTTRFKELVESQDIFNKSGTGTYVYEDEVNKMEPFGCAVLTVSKTLQNQYESLFTDAASLKGKQNYSCNVDSEFDCDLAPCLSTPKLTAQCKQLLRCPYLNARCDALLSNFSIYNYSSFLTLPEFLQRKQFIICDEASELEDELVKFYSCDINYKLLKADNLKIDKLLTEDRGAAFRWLNDLAATLSTRIAELQREFIKSKKNKRKAMSVANQYRFFRNCLEKVLGALQNWHATEYIVEIDGDGAKFTPLNINMLAQDFFKNAEVVILMSGTIIDHATFAKTLGIEEYEYIEVESEFDPTNSPIYCLEKYKLNHKNLNIHLPEVVKVAVKVCEKYPDSKGIIHTHTFKITEALQKAIKGQPRYLLRAPGVTNETIINTHKLSDDHTILISPSLGFGTDLADEFGRFSIIMKTPYLPLGDKRIKTLAERNWRWYQMRALMNLIQMCGRTTRNKDDYSDTFILDGTAVELIKSNLNIIPAYFKNRLH